MRVQVATRGQVKQAKRVAALYWRTSLGHLGRVVFGLYLPVAIVIVCALTRRY